MMLSNAMLRYCVVWIGLEVAVATTGVPQLAWAEVPPVTQTYTQTLEIEYVSEQDAQAASLSITPVLHGKTWAMSARWDDNRPGNTRMAQLMARYSWPGTFYLNATGRNEQQYGQACVQGLLDAGSDIGGHTQSHDVLTALNPNEIFHEMIANRIEREAQGDRPINSFAFPFGRFQHNQLPEVLEAMTVCFVTAGFHHSVYRDFAVNNPHLTPHAISAAIETRPGDRDVDLSRFDKIIAAAMHDAEKRRELTPCLYLGIHVGYQGEGWNAIEELFRKYANRPDWWYCTLTQYAAYERQRGQTTIERVSVTGARARYRITRPYPRDLGAAVPLTIEVHGGAVRHATSDANCVRVPDEQRVLFDLEHSPGHGVATLIDAFHNPENQPHASTTAQSLADAHLYCDVASETLQLTIRNGTSEPMDDAVVTWRLPPCYQQTLVSESIESLPAGQSRVLTWRLGEKRTSSYFLQGSPSVAAQIDTHIGTREVRLHATTRLPPLPQAVTPVRDAARMLGPLLESDDVAADLAQVSRPGDVPADLGPAPWLQWFTASDNDRRRYSDERVTLYRDNKQWNTRMSSTVNQPRAFLVALDFVLTEQTALDVRSELPVTAMYLNGETLAAGSTLQGAQGANRLILRLQTKDDRSGFKPYPTFVQVTPARGDLTYEPAPLRP